MNYSIPATFGTIGVTLGLVATLAAGPANAAPGHSPAVREHLAITRIIQDVGFTLDRDTKVCREERAYGYVESRPQRKFVICFNNHKPGDTAELYDTVRHEAIHVAQYCNGGMLLPQYRDRIIADAQDVGWAPLSYETKVWGIEAEAHLMAHHMTPVQIQQILRKYCF